MAKKWKRIVVVVAVVALLVVGAFVVNSWLDPFDDRPFDAASWAAAKEHERDRGRMARDAIHHIPNGTPATRVRELLGEPDEAQSGYPADRWGHPVKGYTRWIYDLGSMWAYGLRWYDGASLEVHFDHDDRVVAAEIEGG